MRFAPLLLCCLSFLSSPFGFAQVSAGDQEAEPRTVAKKALIDSLLPGDRITIVGNGTAERLMMAGNFEALVHTYYRGKNLVLRSLAWPGDTPGLQPRPLNYGSQEQHLTDLQTDVILAFFGWNESFGHQDGTQAHAWQHTTERPQGEAGVEAFRVELEDWLERMRGLTCSDGGAPRIVLFSPLPQLGPLAPEHPWMVERNRDLARVDAMMRAFAEENSIGFVSLFDPARPSEALDPTLVKQPGLALNQEGRWRLAYLVFENMFGTKLLSSVESKLVSLAQEKNQHWYYRYRAVNGFYIYGGRKDPFGVISFPGEMQRLDAIVEQYDQALWAVADKRSDKGLIDLENFPPLPEVPTNFKRPIKVLTPEEQLATFEMAPGYSIELVASEIEFPELENPVSLTFDTKGRLWVSVMPSYPQVLPGTKPNDKLLIFEDTDGDGRADLCKTFADGLHLPAGFELGHGGAYVAQMPNLVFLPDEDDDDRADGMITLLRGFGTEDSHHAISAFTWDPGGGLHFQEGTFHHSQVETAWGPVRLFNGGVFRFEPVHGRLSVHLPWAFYNPWGHVFDAGGFEIVGDASDGGSYIAAPMATQTSYDRSRRGLPSFTKNQVRPTGGAEIITGPAFPKEVQGDYLVSNTIGFQGIRAHKLRNDGSGIFADESWDLVSSSDPNFRPIDMQIGPDGALYFVDWFNPLIGHMQHSLRDPNRDHSHGRIWRIVFDDLRENGVLHPKNLNQYSPEELLGFLDRDYDRPLFRNSRLQYRIRRAWTEPGDQKETRQDALEQAIETRLKVPDSVMAEDYDMQIFWLAQRTRSVIDLNQNRVTPALKLLTKIQDGAGPEETAAVLRALVQEWPDWQVAMGLPPKKTKSPSSTPALGYVKA